MTTITERIELLEKQMAMLISSRESISQVDVKLVKSTPDKANKANKPNKPRTSGYILFSAAMRDETKVKLSADGANFKNQDIMAEIAFLWKSLSDEQRDDWKTQAIKQQQA
jgi:hypothetical protein